MAASELAREDCGFDFRGVLVGQAEDGLVEGGEAACLLADEAGLGELAEAVKIEHGADPGEIVLISPFRDCAKRLKSIAKQYGLRPENAGTVHTAQGKEADVVMLVLGGNPQVPGAKSWAAQRPNLLNVAVSRAKKRIYVFGDRKSWMGENYFGVLASALHEGRVGAAQRN